jgi:hypothetical protein
MKIQFYLYFDYAYTNCFFSHAIPTKFDYENQQQDQVKPDRTTAYTVL